MSLELLKPVLSLLPAYGVRYEHPAEAIKAWKDGKDFLILPNGPYCSIRDNLTAEYRIHIWHNPKSHAFTEIL